MILRYLILSTVLSFGVAIAAAHLHPYGNPWRPEPQGATSLLHDAAMPAETRDVLVKKCADCHSDATREPFYASLAPASWLVERDIVKARAHMNLSRWQELTPEQRAVLAEGIVHQAKTGKMPPVQYRLLHWDARLSAQDVRALTALRTGSEEAEATTHETADAAHGKIVFERRCAGCHALDENREGPQLRTVYGRKAGSIAGFKYSPSVARLGLIWNPETLDRWLTDPDVMVPGNDMSFATPKAADRRDVIAYLQQLTGSK